MTPLELARLVLDKYGTDSAATSVHLAREVIRLSEECSRHAATIVAAERLLKILSREVIRLSEECARVTRERGRFMDEVDRQDKQLSHHAAIVAAAEAWRENTRGGLYADTSPHERLVRAIDAARAAKEGK